MLNFTKTYGNFTFVVSGLANLITNHERHHQVIRIFLYFSFKLQVLTLHFTDLINVLKRSRKNICFYHFHCNCFDSNKCALLLIIVFNLDSCGGRMVINDYVEDKNSAFFLNLNALATIFIFNSNTRLSPMDILELFGKFSDHPFSFLGN